MIHLASDWLAIAEACAKREDSLADFPANRRSLSGARRPRRMRHLLLRRLIGYCTTRIVRINGESHRLKDRRRAVT